MPVKVDAKDRKLLLVAGGVFVLLIAVTVAFSGDEPNNAGVPSTYSAASGGAKAAYLVLARAGYKVERWESPLDQLPRGAGKTLILAEPGEAPTHGEKERLKAFLTEGGRVIATGASAGTLLPENDSEREVEVFGAEKWKKASELSPSAITRAAPEIVLAAGAVDNVFGGLSAVRGRRADAGGEVSVWARGSVVVGVGNSADQRRIEGARQSGIPAGLPGERERRGREKWDSVGRIYSWLSTDAGVVDCSFAGEVAGVAVGAAGVGGSDYVFATEWPDLQAGFGGAIVAD